MDYAVICVPLATIYDRPAETKEGKKGIVSAIADDSFYGYVVRVLEDGEEWVRILTFYGYAGYVHADVLKRMTEAELAAYLSRDLKVVSNRMLDVLSLPAVAGVRLMSLSAGSLLAAGEEKDGYTKVSLLDGSEGYVYSAFLEEKRFSEDAFTVDPEKMEAILSNASTRSASAMGGREGFCLQTVLDTWYEGSEEKFRKELTRLAKSYLGTQYRWGSRSGAGLDCSGLVSISYLRAGVTIYRDAAIADGYAIKRLPMTTDLENHLIEEAFTDGSILPGDALYFPGHIAMYLGEGRYIHSTGHIGDNGVVINSLKKSDPLFREDLFNCLLAVGGVR